MKNLSKIMATGIAAQKDFLQNLAELIDNCPRVAELLAEGVQPKMTTQEIEIKAQKEYGKRGGKIVKIDYPIMDQSLKWRTKVYISYTKYYKDEKHSDYGVYTIDDNHPYEGHEETYSWMDIE